MKSAFKTGIFTLAALALLGCQASAQTSEIGSLDDEGNTFLFYQQLEGVYGNNWTGRFDGDQSDGSARVKIVADGKLPFDGVLTVSCKDADQFTWVKDPDSFLSADSVPADVITNARKLFC